MRKLTMIGLSLMLGVGAFAQAQLQPTKARKLSASSKARTERTVSLKLPVRDNALTVGTSAVPGLVEKKSGTTRALIPTTPAKSKAKAPVTTDNLFAGVLTPAAQRGVIKVNPATGAVTRLFSSSAVHGLGVNPDLKEIYTVEYIQSGSNVSDLYYRAYDLNTGTVKREVEISTNEQLGNMPQRSAYNPRENAIYGYAINGWVKLDCNTLESTAIIASDVFPFALTYNSKTDKFMALANTTEGMVIATVDAATGNLSNPELIAGLRTQYLGGFAYDYISDSYLFNLHDGTRTSTLLSIDATTKAVTTVCRINGAPQTGCLYVDEVRAADPLAPATPKFGTASFPDGSLTGTVTFVMPTKTADKVEASDLTGQLTYVIKADGEQIATGSAAPGAEVTANYTATASGEVTFSCSAAKDNHTGKAGMETVYIGNDTPTAPANVRLTPVTVTWDPVTTGIHNGYVDPAKVTYNVTINGNPVADGISATSCPTNLPVNAEMTNYVARVTATFNGLTGPEGTSNDVMFGQPYNEPMRLDPTPAEARLFTIVDNNNDRQKWTYSAADSTFSIRYNSTAQMDDYLILPPVMIKDISKLHHFSFDAWAASSVYEEAVEVWIGREPTAAGMTTKVMDRTVIDWRDSDKKNLGCDFIIPEAGQWYIAIKGVSEPDLLRIYVNNFALELSDISSKGPGIVENVTVTPGAQGALNATVRFNLPTKANDGSALTGEVEATVETDVDYKTVTGAPGAEVSAEVMTLQGDNDIIIQTMQGDALGFSVTVTAYTGVVAPAAVTNMTLTANESNYGIYARYDAPEEGINGGYINKNELTYALFQNQPIDLGWLGTYDNWVKIADLGTLTELDADLLDEGATLGVYELGIAAENVAGTGELLYSSMTLGEPYALPVIENFNTGNADIQPIMFNTAGGMDIMGLDTAETWADVIQTPADLSEINPAFGNGGSAVVATGLNDAYGYLFLPPMSTKGANKASLQLNYYVGAARNVTVYAQAFGVETEEIFNESYLYGFPDGFQTMTIELPAKFQNKGWVSFTVRIDFSDEKQYFVWNGYKLVNMVQKDMVALDVKAPVRVANGAEYNVTVDVANYGISTATDYSVELYANGDKVAEKAGVELAPYAEGQVVFAQTMSPVAAEPVEYYAVLVQAGDANTDNNETATVTVTPRESRLPGATELTAADSDNAVALTWNEPDMTVKAPEPVTYDFEDGDAFAAEYGDWIFVDVDDSPVGGIQNMDIPGIAGGQTKGSFWIWDQDVLGAGNKTFEAHSGSKYLFSMFRYDDGQADDWAISPELTGDAQSVSFWAKSYSADYPETIEVLYSTGSTDPKDFQVIEGSAVASVPNEWTEYTVELPEGATRFAIRSYASSSFMLMVDDVTLTPAPAFTSETSLMGYDVYRDGVKLNEAPVENTAYADTDVVKGTEYSYVVVALYNEGAGSLSNTATIVYGQSGLDSLEASQAVATGKNLIVVRGFEGQTVTVSTADGKVVANGKADSDRETISVPAGVYVVKAGSKSVKVIVK